MSTGPTTLAAARTDLARSQAFARQARQAAHWARVDARACLAVSSDDACEDLVVAAQEARIRAEQAATEASHCDAVVQHLLAAIDATVAPTRQQATRAFTTHVTRAQQRLVRVQQQVQTRAQAFVAATQARWQDALDAYATSVARAGQVARQASDQRLRDVRTYALQRAATVKQIQRTYQQMVHRGQVAAAQAYLKRAYAALTIRDQAFDARMAQLRDEAAAAYDTAVAAAKDVLDRTRAEKEQALKEQQAQAAAELAEATKLYTTEVETAADLRDETIAQAQEQAEATVTIDPATVPVEEPTPPADETGQAGDPGAGSGGAGGGDEQGVDDGSAPASTSGE